MKIYKYILFLLVAVILIAPFFFVVNISDVFLKYMGDNYAVSSLVYIFALILSVVVAPFTMPLFLIAGGIFGSLAASLYNIIGWSVGAIIAFLLARFLGRPVLSKFVSLKSIDKYEKKIPEKLEFFGVVLLRMVLPVDLLSYALGFFSKISFFNYTVATIIGITPFAILFAYGGSALFEGNYFIVIIMAVVTLLALGIGYYLVKDKSEER
jgi:uncharacterized membrane protein YdjX (TVP38/TMEM64 family)